MSIKLIDKALDSTIPPGPRLVLVVLADHAGHKGMCWPGQKRIMHRTGYKERAVRDHLNWLEKNGYIKRWRPHIPGKVSSQYHYLLLHENWQAAEFAGEEDDFTSIPIEQPAELAGTYRQNPPKQPAISAAKSLEEPLEEPAVSASANMYPEKKASKPKKDPEFGKEEAESITYQSVLSEKSYGDHTIYGMWTTEVGAKTGKFQKILTNKDTGQLKKAMVVIEDREYLRYIIQNWNSFTSEVEFSKGWKESPFHPDIGFLLKTCDIARTFAEKKLKSIANPAPIPETVTNATKVKKLTVAQIMAIQDQIHDD